MLENTYIWFLITIFTIIIEWVVLNKILCHTSHIKVDNVKVTISLSIIIIIAIAMNLLNIYPNSRIVISIFMASVFYKYIYNENIFISLIVPLIYWMLLLGIEAISMSLIVGLHSLDSMNNLMDLNIYRLQVIILSKGILILAATFYCKFRIDIIDISKKDIGYIFIPIITNIVSFLVIYKYVIEIKEIDILNNKELIITSFLLVLSNICLILSIRKIIIDNRLIAEGKLIKEKMKMQYTHYINIQQDNMKVRQLHHDIKNHIACIKGITQSSDDAIKYINNIENELHRYGNSFDSGNMILDIILNEKSKVCIERSIKILIDINNFDKCDFIDTIDICSIFSNILDNAIEACDKVNDLKKEIVLRGTIVNNFFVIKVENTKQNKINKKDNTIKTDKKDAYLHGLGIKSVKDSVFKYDGEVVIDYSENRFIMKILIPLVPK